jgi:hypothetical protein
MRVVEHGEEATAATTAQVKGGEEWWVWRRVGDVV